jgi:hypothetical protein
MIGPSGLLLVVPHVYAVPVSFIGRVAKKRKAKLRHLILLSRVTYIALVQMLLVLTPFDY